MLKYIYKMIILAIIFILSILYFSKDIKESVFNIDVIKELEKSTLPVVKIEIDNNEVNLLRGYRSNLKANLVRDAIVPLNNEKGYNIHIEEDNYNIKKVKYEVRELKGNDLIEANFISVFEEVEDGKKVKIKLTSDLENEKEYAVKIILITSDGNKINYYHRIKIFEELYLKEKIKFIMDFNKKTFDKNEAKDLIKYIETKNDSDSSSLSYVNIYSNIDLISWGNLKPVIISEITPTIMEYYEDIASIELDYFIEADVNGVRELYNVKEFYRIRYTSTRIYLLNYERRLESNFDINLASVAKNELKLGITSNYKLDYLLSDDNTKLVFIRNREMWYYDLEHNNIYNVFSFSRDNWDNRGWFKQHNIKILDINQEGNINFIVYGYMNSGIYEGRVGILLYRYIASDNRIEELLYIPVDTSYELLKHDLGDIIVLNPKNVLYFNIKDLLFSYDLITEKLTQVADNIENICITKDKRYIVYQEDIRKDNLIRIIDTFEDNEISINPPKGEKINLFGLTGDNIIFSYIKEKDNLKNSYGKEINPSYQLNISDISGKVLKEYNKKGYYIEDIRIEDNIIELFRIKKNNNLYEISDSDFILNQIKEEEPLIKVTKRVTEEALTEAYISLYEGFVMPQTPEYFSSKASIVKEDPTIRIIVDNLERELFYPYAFGGVYKPYENISDAIKTANEKAGVVINDKQQIVWERGVKASNMTIKGVDDYSLNKNLTSLEAAIYTLLNHQGVNILDIKRNNHDKIYEVYKDNSLLTPIVGNGASLDDILYYVSKGSLVMIFIEKSQPVIIYGYDSFNVLIYEPNLKKLSKIGSNDCSKKFDNMGGYFVTYIK